MYKYNTLYIDKQEVL